MIEKPARVFVVRRGPIRLRDRLENGELTFELARP
jgi:hypothetical protein